MLGYGGPKPGRGTSGGPPPPGAPSNVIQSTAGAWFVSALAPIGAVVYASGLNAASVATSATFATTPVTGIIVAKPSPVTATIAYAGEVSVFAGLVPGAVYYLGLAGAITLIPPGVGPSAVQRLGRAKNATTLVLFPGEPVEITAP